MTVARNHNLGVATAGRLLGFVLAACLVFGLTASTASAAPEWDKYDLPGTSTLQPFPILGQPSDLSCWSANACILLTIGNGTFPNGVFAFTGDTAVEADGWKQYATVCGPGQANAGYARLAWAGPNEFWTVTTPSSPFDTANPGRGLCHFSGGHVVGSYSTIRGNADTSDDPYRSMNAAACRSSNECWFGGIAAARPDGTSPGTFHLRWDGSNLRSVYAPATRGAADIESWGGGFAESVYAGPDASRKVDETLPVLPSSSYSPIQLIDAGASTADGFGDGDLEPDVSGFVEEATEVLAVDAGLPSAPGSMLWAVGGGAMSGPAKVPDINDEGLSDNTPADTGPFVAYREAGAGNSWHQINAPSGPAWIDTRFVDVAAIPGTDEAIAAIAPGNELLLGNAPSEIAKLDASAGTVEIVEIGELGSVQRVECVNANQCWAATADGKMLRYADPATPVAANGDLAFKNPVLSRPNEVIEQALADSSTDDSLLFAPAPVTDAAEPDPPKRQRAAVGKVKTKLRGTRLTFSFKTFRKVRVTIQGKRRGRVVAQTKSGLLRPGKHRMVLRLSVKRWPTKIAMNVKEPAKAKASATQLRCGLLTGCER